MPRDPSAPTLLLIGASRGLGLAMAAEFLAKGWNILGTVRDSARPGLLHALAAAHPGRVEIATLDTRLPAQRAALVERLAGRQCAMLFVNAGTTNPDPGQTIGEVSVQDFTDLMIVNALAPLQTIEALAPCVAPDGLIGAMSSGQGSIANNESGQREVYRISKAALNMGMRSFAARQAATRRALVLMAPGWVRTELGGPQAPLSIEASIPSLVEVLLAKRARPGLEYLDYRGRIVPW
ncbi:MAG: SDR family NAD(P)-dependent oxidoreductase [Rhodospirillales bacterium]|nr:SDR family NAD(P)-dependent oxidoreductase [Rhodospirillales bacterium]